MQNRINIIIRAVSFFNIFWFYVFIYVRINGNILLDVEAMRMFRWRMSS